MAAGFAALTVGVVVSLCLQIYGESLSQPGKVRFVADIINHILHWTPGVNHSSDTLYEVEYKLYGKSGPWMAVPDCTGISGHSCDLTYQTMDPSQRYYARVRAVSGNHTSGWTRTNAFSLKEATLRLSDVSLSVTGNTIHVTLQQLILRVGNKTVSYKDIQQYGRQYRTYVRRASDNLQQVQVETREEFDIPMLLWGEQYCVRVEPRVLSRPVPSIGTEEKCVTIPEKDESTGIISVSVGIVLLVFSATLLLGTLLLCAYIKQPMRTPAILKSLLKPSGSEHEHFPFGSKDVVVCLDEESIQQLSVCQRDTVQHHSTDSGSSPAQQPPDKGCRFLTSPDDHEHLLELEDLAEGDSSCTSTDSGICLQDSSSGLSQFSGSESQDYQRQLPGSDDSGISLARHSLCLTLSSSGRDYTSVDEEQDQRERERDCSPLASGLSQEAVEFRGYLKQPKGTVERQQDRAEGQLPTKSPGGTDNTLEMGCSEPALAKGYLKQASPGLTYGNADTVLARESDSQGFTSRLECNSSSLLNYGALGISVPSKSLPEFPKAPFALGIFNTDLLGSLPLISSLHSNERLCLEIDSLSLLGSECKDSRL
ncbi:interleukin-10 receptor subunit alpha [Malaclemys terrapin pileata]|uniref:interleukin-10 receptor subunit alpha n=1 Tax=Malaclemys terrapin pileata TaxID=2991368 RepID=UPI0023A7E63A|nr:interleukin-10 receptor subunit alpha [Malaclemys terrapin pileata]